MTRNGFWSNVKKYSKKVWHFLWHEDSIWSWIVNILLAFVLIKFLIYPGIGLVLGTNLPVVAVVSESMQHDGQFDKWWVSPAICSFNGTVKSCTQENWYSHYDINKEQFLYYRMHNGFNKGDIIILKGVDYDTLQIGDILVYQTQLPYPVIHRVIDKNDVIQTKGDHNQAQIYDSRINEKYITKDQIIGKAWLKIPYLGYVKIWFTQLLQCVSFNGCSFK